MKQMMAVPRERAIGGVQRIPNEASAKGAVIFRFCSDSLLSVVFFKLTS
jgi:hypothetical protein